MWRLYTHLQRADLGRISVCSDGSELHERGRRRSSSCVTLEPKMHKKSALSLIAASVLLLTGRTAFGQITGCVDSPEDPTVVMAVLGGGAAAVQFAWSRFRSRKNNN